MVLHAPIITSVVLNLIALSWIISVEKRGCACLQDWRRQYLKYWYVFAIVLTILSPTVPPQVLALVSIAGLVAFATLVSALWTVQAEHCTCAQDWRERVLLFTTGLSLLALAFAALGFFPSLK